jgi:hypothetical protein
VVFVAVGMAVGTVVLVAVGVTVAHLASPAPVPQCL